MTKITERKRVLRGGVPNPDRQVAQEVAESQAIKSPVVPGLNRVKENRPAKNLLRVVPDLDLRNDAGLDPSTKNPRPASRGQNLSTEIRDVRGQSRSTRSLQGTADVPVREVVQGAVVAKVFRLITAVIVDRRRAKLTLTKVLETEKDVVNGLKSTSSFVFNLPISGNTFWSIHFGCKTGQISYTVHW